jgi:hypothetical protein
MLRKILALTVAACAATFLMAPDALAWGGSWSHSGSTSYTGRGGNTYSTSHSGSGSGYHYGGGGYHYAGRASYGGGYHYASGGACYGGASIQEVSSPGMRPESIDPSRDPEERSATGNWAFNLTLRDGGSKIELLKPWELLIS